VIATSSNENGKEESKEPDYGEDQDLLEEEEEEEQEKETGEVTTNQVF
jgi:hypothetical protein